MRAGRHERVNRRAFVARVVGAAFALGLGSLAHPRPLAAAWVAEPTGGPIPVRIGELAQSGRDFRAGSFEGVSLPGIGGSEIGLWAERPGARFTSEPLEAAFPASHVGLHWRADDLSPDLAVEARGSRDGQRWSPWRRVTVESHGREADRRETFGALVGVAGARWLQYRLTFRRASQDASGVQRVALTYFNAGTTPAAGSRAMRAVARLGPPDFVSRVIPREEWGADESIRFEQGVDLWPRAFVTPKFVAVHHTATDNEYADPAAEVRAIYTYHTVTQGFGDIGYHLLIDNRGQAYEGRRGREPEAAGQEREIVSANVVAGHVLGYNYGSAGIAVLGLFTEVEPTPAAMDTLEEALAFEALRHGLDPLARTDFLRARGTAGASTMWRDELAVISGHRDCIATECPGEQLYLQLPRVREGVAARIGQVTPGLRFTQGPPERDLWPTDLLFAWQGSEAAVEFSSRLEGFRLAIEPDLIVPLSGYADDQSEVWGPWSRATRASFALPQNASGSYTLQVRARDARGRTLPDQARWPLWVDRQVVVDNRDQDRAVRIGPWQVSTEILAFNGRDYEQAEPAAGPAQFTWRLRAPEAGSYRVLACWADGGNRASDARYTIRVDDEIVTSVAVDQRERGASWVELARVSLNGDAVCQVELSNRADGVVVADAVRILLVD